MRSSSWLLAVGDSEARWMARSSLGRWRTHGEDAVLVIGVAEVGDDLDGARPRAATKMNNGGRERESSGGVCGG
jgi:hypothetical protein